MLVDIYMPVEAYLRTTFRPDCDYVDGEIEERNLGEQWHGLVQTMIALIFAKHLPQWGLRPVTEQRVQVLPTTFRIPDVCVVRNSDPVQGILDYPPLLCVEVLSPDDRIPKLMVRVREFLAMGVPAVWIVDPRSREIWTVGVDGERVPLTSDVLLLQGTAARVEVSEIFALIDGAGSEPPATQV